MKYLLVDLETGGLDAKEHSLLTGYLAILDENFQKVRDLSFKLKHAIYRVTAVAMVINKIDLVQHDLIAEDRFAINSKLFTFMHPNTESPAEPRLTVIGHNPMGLDIPFLRENFPHYFTDKYISHRVLDTAAIAMAVALAGKIPADVFSLGKLHRHFHGDPKGEAHTAEYDAQMTLEVLQSLVGVIRS